MLGCLAMSQCSLTILLFSLACLLTSAQKCEVLYRPRGSNGRPLLYGGLQEPGRVLAGGTLRTGFWSDVCSYSNSSGRPTVCTPQQANRSFAYAMTLGNGSIADFSPCDLIPYLRGRTLWIIGDSHAKTFYRALQCFLIDFWGQQECATSTDPELLRQLEKLPAAPGQNYCLHFTGVLGGRVCLVHVVLGTSLLNSTQVADGGVLPLLRNKFAQPQDIFYINFNIWHKKLLDWQKTYMPSLEALGSYYQATKNKWPHILWRETPAEHPRTPAMDTCMPARGWLYDTTTGQLSVDPAARLDAGNPNQSWVLGLPYQRIASQVLGKYGIPIVPALNITVPLWDNHTPIKLQSGWIDCMHYCHPGVPEMWVWYFYEALRSGAGNVVPLPLPSVTAEAAAYPCKFLQSVA